MIGPKTETEDLLLLKTKCCETLIKQIIQNPKDLWNWNQPNQQKHFILFHLYQFKDLKF